MADETHRGVVPNVPGMYLREALHVADEAGLKLVHADDSGTTIDALSWPEPHVVIEQNPEPGGTAEAAGIVRVRLH